MIPLLHDFEGATVLVLGGGTVGARRARRFAREARVIVVSPAFADAEFGDAERVRAAPGAGDVGGWIERVAPRLVVAATDDEAVNAAAETAAREQGCLVSRADAGAGRGPGRVTVPATVRDGPVTVAVATGGTSPALSRYLRERIGEDLEGAGAVAAATGALRSELSDCDIPAGKRRAALRAAVAADSVWAAARDPDGDTEAVAREVAAAVLEE